jgi:hypothetical protein
MAAAAAGTAMALSLAACAAPPVDAAQPLSGRQRAVLDVASSADVEFGFVAELDVDSRGWMYVADAMGHVVVLDPQARLERRIGSYGRGPGEFEALHNLQVVEGDSLFVFDLMQARGTVFAPGAERPAYTTSLATGGMRPYTLRRIGSDGRMAAIFRAIYRQGDGRSPDTPRQEVVRLLNGDGSLERDSVLVLPEAESLLMYREGAFTGVIGYPQGRRNIIRIGRSGRLYRVWTDSATVQVTSAHGRPLESIRPREPRSPRPFTRADADALVRKLAEGSPTEAEARGMVDQKRITSWPLVHDFVIDDHERAWIGYAPLEDGGDVEWVGYGADGEQIGSFRLPASVTVHRFHGDRLYADVRDDLDVQTVAVFRLHDEGE